MIERPLAGSVLGDSTTLYSRPVLTIEDHPDYVILAPEEPSWVRVNTAGQRLLRKCRSGLRLDRMLDGYPDDSISSVDAIRAFLVELLNLGIISDQPAKNIPYTGSNLREQPRSLDKVAVHVDAAVSDKAELLISLISECRSLGCREVVLCSQAGVPVWAQRPLVAAIVNQGMKARLVTNDSELDHETLAILSKTGSRVAIQVDGNNRRLNDRLRGAGAFRMALRNAALSMEAGVPVMAVTHLCDDNLSSLAAIREFLKGLGIQGHTVSWQKIVGGVTHRPRRPASPEAVRRVLDEVGDRDTAGHLADEMRRVAMTLTVGKGTKLDLCDGAWGSLAVDANADVYPCSWCARTGNLKLGSATESGLAEVWLNSIEATLIRQNSLQRSPRCYLCSVKYFCGGLVSCLAGCAHLSSGELDGGNDLEVFCETFRDFVRSQILRLSRQAAAGSPPTRQPKVLSRMRRLAPSSSQESSDRGPTNGVRRFDATIGP